MEQKSLLAAGELLGENLCLDFINPVVVDSENDYFFRSYNHLLDWGVLTGTLTEADAARLGSAASPGQAEDLVSYARSLRARLDLALRASARGEDLEPFLNDLDQAMAAASAHRRLSTKHNRVVWDWPFDGDLGMMIWPVVPAAVDLLMSPELAKLKICQGCGWLFLDSSKNHSRRWCRMRDCGNVAKVRSHRRRGRVREA